MLAFIRAPKYIKQILTGIKREIDGNTIEDFNTPLTSIDRPDRKSIRQQRS